MPVTILDWKVAGPATFHWQAKSKLEEIVDLYNKRKLVALYNLPNTDQIKRIFVEMDIVTGEVFVGDKNTVALWQDMNGEPWLDLDLGSRPAVSNLLPEPDFSLEEITLGDDLYSELSTKHKRTIQE